MATKRKPHSAKDVALNEKLRGVWMGIGVVNACVKDYAARPTTENRERLRDAAGALYLTTKKLT